VRRPLGLTITCPTPLGTSPGFGLTDGAIANLVPLSGKCPPAPANPFRFAGSSRAGGSAPYAPRVWLPEDLGEHLLQDDEFEIEAERDHQRSLVGEGFRFSGEVVAPASVPLNELLALANDAHAYD
jgi:hypothetical protein